MVDYNANDVHASAMLADLSISQWSARKQDKRVAEAVAEANGVDARAGSYYKSLIDPAAIEGLKKLVGEIRTYHYKATLPWSDEGPRVLPTTMYFDYMENMRQYRQQYDDTVNEILTQYPYHREEAKRYLGNLFREEDYPEPEKLAKKYGFHLTLYPLPKGDDFRCEIGAEEIEQVREDIESQTRASLQKSVTEAFNRIYGVVAKYVDRLGDPETVFKSSMVENARELVEIMPKLNFTQDPELDRITQVVRDNLCQYEPDQLRHNPDARKQAYNTASSLKSDLDTFFSGGFQ